jgi:hypothetical protein
MVASAPTGLRTIVPSLHVKSLRIVRFWPKGHRGSARPALSYEQSNGPARRFDDRLCSARAGGCAADRGKSTTGGFSVWPVIVGAVVLIAVVVVAAIRPLGRG